MLAEGEETYWMVVLLGDDSRTVTDGKRLLTIEARSSLDRERLPASIDVANIDMSALACS